MIKELVTDEALLTTPCEPATAEDAAVAQDLLDTAASIDEIGCLAANQIGVTKAIAVYMDDQDVPHVIYNPKIKRALHAYRTTETCLTKEGETKVTRYDSMTLVYDELVDGELVPREQNLQGFTAELVQHAIDHCKGHYI